MPTNELPCPAIPTRYNPLDPIQRENPYPTYAEMRREQPLSYSPLFDSWLVTRYADVQLVLKDHARFTSSMNMLQPRVPLPPEAQAVLQDSMSRMRSIVNSDPPQHTRIRNLVSREFTPQRMAALEPQLHALASKLIDSFIDAGEADLIQQFCVPFAAAVIADLLSIPRADIAMFKRWADDVIVLVSGIGTTEQLVTAAHGLLQMQAYTRDRLQQRAASPQDDLLSRLAQAVQDDPDALSEDELVALPMQLLVAGHETTINMLGNALVLLLHHADQLQAMRDDPTLIAGAIDEVLRHDTPILVVNRRTTTQVEIDGVLLPAGTKLLLVMGAANHDETHFSTPEHFDIQRPNADKHLAFGRGIHFCLGAALARLEGRVCLELLLRRLPGLRFRSDEPVHRASTIVLRGYQHLYLVWDQPG